jgi:transcriptional regulator with XRE-family HTH domain
MAKPRWADLLRQAIRDSGLSAAALGKATGVAQQTISEFLRGKDLRLATAEKIGRHLGVELRKPAP